MTGVKWSTQRLKARWKSSIIPIQLESIELFVFIQFPLWILFITSWRRVILVTS